LIIEHQTIKNDSQSENIYKTPIKTNTKNLVDKNLKSEAINDTAETSHAKDSVAEEIDIEECYRTIEDSHLPTNIRIYALEMSDCKLQELMVDNCSYADNILKCRQEQEEVADIYKKQLVKNYKALDKLQQQSNKNNKGNK